MVSNSLHGRYWHACKHLRTAHQAVVELWKVWYKQKNALDCIALRNSFYFASKYSSVSVWSTLYSSTMAAVCRAVGVYHANYKELWESGSFQRCFFLVQCPLYPVLPKFTQHYPATTSQPVCQYTLFPNDQMLPGGDKWCSILKLIIFSFQIVGGPLSKKNKNALHSGLGCFCAKDCDHWYLLNV